MAAPFLLVLTFAVGVSGSPGQMQLPLDCDDMACVKETIARVERVPQLYRLRVFDQTQGKFVPLGGNAGTTAWPPIIERLYQ